jgi:CheY-like chemotaxis protein
MLPNPSELGPESSAPKGGIGRLRILVVDDEAAIRQIIRKHLEAEGHEVHTAIDGVTGFERFVGENWDLVLTDRVMPGVSGDELAEAIKRISPTTPVILVTAYADRSPDPHRRDSPFDITIRKPFTRETIRAALAAVCR